MLDAATPPSCILNMCQGNLFKRPFATQTALAICQLYIVLSSSFLHFQIKLCVWVYFCDLNKKLTRLLTGSGSCLLGKKCINVE